MQKLALRTESLEISICLKNESGFSFVTEVYEVAGSERIFASRTIFVNLIQACFVLRAYEYSLRT